MSQDFTLVDTNDDSILTRPGKQEVAAVILDTLVRHMLIRINPMKIWKSKN